MWPVLSKLFIRNFYRANTGFFLFLFFIFFGSVEGSALPSYHFSLMKSMLDSAAVCMLVFCFWTLYHLKCTVFFLRIINSSEGIFLHSLQSLSSGRQWQLYIALYIAVYAPVLIYAIVVFVVGWKEGYRVNAASILVFQFLSLAFASSIIHYRINHWLEKFHMPAFPWRFRKNNLLYVYHYFTTEKKRFLLVLKAFSILLLYIILVWNRGRYDNDSFMLFYLVLLLANAALPYLAVRFWEKSFPLFRNLPLSLLKRAVAFVLPYCILLLPEAAYLFYFGESLSLMHKFGYVMNLLASLSLLTAIQYSEAQSREEYLKATFALFFVSIFMLHVQAFWLWIAAQFVVAGILFGNGYYRYQPLEE